MSGPGVLTGVRLPLGNETVANRLDEVATLLAAQGANRFRVQAYRRAAEILRDLERPAHEILEEQGLDGLTALPGIGDSLVRAIEQLVHSDRLSLLEQLRGGLSSQDLFCTVPSIGPEFARRIHEELGIETLYELEIAANDGRLDKVPGMGSGRVRAVRESLAGRFRRGARPPESSQRRRSGAQPPVAELLDVDREYREKAEAGRLIRIAPKRFNPTGESWLPILHAARESRHYTALFSNTGRAHELGTTRDWVVIYRDDHEGDGQWTVVTGRLGELHGRRIVRGREAECRRHYEHAAEGADE